MFHYPSELSHWWGRRGGGSDRVAVERRDWPRLAANHRIVATCRILSQSAVIGRKTSSSAQGKKIGVPKPPRHFLISRGPSWGFERIATERLLSRRCSAIPLQSMKSFPVSTIPRSLAPKMAGPAKFLVHKYLGHSPIRRGCFVLERASLQAIKKYYRPATPSPFPLYATAGGKGMAERKSFCPERPLPLPLSREGVFCAWIT
jgi:hypothetical protein